MSNGKLYWQRLKACPVRMAAHLASRRKWQNEKRSREPKNESIQALHKMELERSIAAAKRMNQKAIAMAKTKLLKPDQYGIVLVGNKTWP